MLYGKKDYEHRLIQFLSCVSQNFGLICYLKENFLGDMHMNRLPELIAAYVAMDQFARDVIVESAKAYAQSRARSAARGQLRAFPRPFNDHSSSDGISNAQKKGLVCVSSETVHEE